MGRVVNIVPCFLARGVFQEQAGKCVIARSRLLGMRGSKGREPPSALRRDMALDRDSAISDPITCVVLYPGVM